ncbi:MAG TPA: hypothetical protein VGU43_05145 [Thermoplasmata archaeon]|nr:hypothetical protein [Thermoplasmata archaeon]
MPPSRGAGGPVAFRFGLVLVPLIFFESALGVFSAGAGAQRGSGLFNLHVALGLLILLLAAGAFLLGWRRDTPVARASSGLVLVATVAVAIVASTSLSVGIASAGLMERSLALVALLGAAGMIVAGYPSRRGIPDLPSPGRASAP